MTTDVIRIVNRYGDEFPVSMELVECAVELWHLGLEPATERVRIVQALMLAGC